MTTRSRGREESDSSQIAVGTPAALYPLPNLVKES